MSEHVIRIVPEASKIDPGYLLAVLRSDYGQAYLARGIFGSVIDEITPDYVGQMPVPLLQDQTRADIAQAVREAEVARDRAVAGFDQAAALLNHALEL
jgi:type I restriction enzyme S subunit